MPTREREESAGAFRSWPSSASDASGVSRRQFLGIISLGAVAACQEEHEEGIDLGSILDRFPSLEAPKPPSLHEQWPRMKERIIRKHTRGQPEAYDIPDAEQMWLFKNATRRMMEGDLERAKEEFALLGYAITPMEDDGSWAPERKGTPYLVLQEEGLEGEFNAKGWGTFIFSPQAVRPELALQAPHPLFDINTGEISLAVFSIQGAGSLYIPGAHRRASSKKIPGTPKYTLADMSHFEQTMGHAVHQVVTERPGTIVLQVHGYNPDEHKRAKRKEVIISSGNDDARTSQQDRWADRLRKEGFDVAVCGENFRTLCGTDSKQKNFSLPGDFIHLELSPAIRNNRKNPETREKWKRLAQALD